MHDESIDQKTAAFLDEVRATFEVGAPPPPRPELAALFASRLRSDKGDLSVTAASKSHGSAPQTSGLPNWTRRHIDMLNDVMEQVRSKAVAAAAGAALVLSGVGASGALNAPLRMISEDGVPTEECVAPTDPVMDDGGTVDETASDCEGTDDTTEVVDGTDGTGTTDDTIDGSEEGGDALAEGPAAEPPAVPSSVSEAAHVHDFDEACGNHGAYVSHFARFGEEPECATTARSAGQDAEGDGETAPTADEADTGTDTGTDDSTQVEHTSAEANAPRSHGEGQGRDVPAKANRGNSGK